MALNAAIVWEVQTGGSDNNGGGFKAGASGVDRSQQTSAQVAIDNSAITTSITTSVITFTAGYSPSANDVGNVVQMLTGTNVTAGFYEITSVVAGTSWTVDRNVVTSGTTTDATGKMGGCLATPGKAGAAAVANNGCYIKSGSYTITSASSNIAGGCVSWPASSGGAEGFIQGYGSSRNDYGTKPVLTASGISTFTVISLAGGKVRVENLEIDGANLTASKGIANATNTSGWAYCCKVSNCKAGAIATFGAVSCEVTGCSTTAAIGCTHAVGCWAHDNTISGFTNSPTFGSASSFAWCIASNNTGASSDGFSPSGPPNLAQFVNCAAYANGRDGFRTGNGSSSMAVAVNCVAVNNSGYGFNLENGGQGQHLVNCAGYNNTSGNVKTSSLNVSFVALSGSPFTDAASNDFSLNNTSGAGASCRAVGFPGVFPSGLTTGYLDIGAVQHQDSGGGSSYSGGVYGG